MEAQAVANYIQMSPRKMRLVADEVRGIDFPEAVDILKAMPKKAARVILKNLLSAGANAKVLNPKLSEADLYVKKITVDIGPTMKRFRPRARGRADRILRRMSKVTVVLSDE